MKLYPKTEKICPCARARLTRIFPAIQPILMYLISIFVEQIYNLSKFYCFIRAHRIVPNVKKKTLLRALTKYIYFLEKKTAYHAHLAKMSFRMCTIMYSRWHINWNTFFFHIKFAHIFYCESVTADILKLIIFGQMVKSEVNFDIITQLVKNWLWRPV